MPLLLLDGGDRLAPRRPTRRTLTSPDRTPCPELRDLPSDPSFTAPSSCVLMSCGSTDRLRDLASFLCAPGSRWGRRAGADPGNTTVAARIEPPARPNPRSTMISCTTLSSLRTPSARAARLAPRASRYAASRSFAPEPVWPLWVPRSRPGWARQDSSEHLGRRGKLAHPGGGRSQHVVYEPPNLGAFPGEAHLCLFAPSPGEPGLYPVRCGGGQPTRAGPARAVRPRRLPPSLLVQLEDRRDLRDGHEVLGVSGTDATLPAG